MVFMTTNPPEYLPASPPPPRSATILLVEDQPQVRRLLAVSLRHMGYELLTAGDGEEALALAADPEQRIDLLVTDVMMPGINGAQLVARMKEGGRHIPVVFISGFTSEVVIAEGPGVTFLQKPFALAELTGAVREALDSASTGD